MMSVLCKVMWLVTAAACLCVGLNAMQVDVVGMLHLGGMQPMLNYLVGLCGAGSLVMFFMDCSGKGCK